jgi:hypothetical protein
MQEATLHSALQTSNEYPASLHTHLNISGVTVSLAAQILSLERFRTRIFFGAGSILDKYVEQISKRVT